MADVFDGDQFDDSSETEEGPFNHVYNYQLTRNGQTITLNVEVDYYPADEDGESYVDVLSANWGDYEFYLSPEEESDMAYDIASQIDEDLEKGEAATP